MTKLSVENRVQGRGYGWIDPGLPYFYPHLTQDEQVRCLIYLMRHIEEVASVPAGVALEIFPGQYLYMGGYYPVIGPYVDGEGVLTESLSMMSISIGEQFEDHIRQVGIQHLLDEENPIPLSWEEVLSGKTVVCHLEQ